MTLGADVRALARRLDQRGRRCRVCAGWPKEAVIGIGLCVVEQVVEVDGSAALPSDLDERSQHEHTLLTGPCPGCGREPPRYLVTEFVAELPAQGT